MLAPDCIVRLVAVMFRLYAWVSLWSWCVSVPAMVMFVAFIGVPPDTEIEVVPDTCWMFVAWNLVPVWFIVLDVRWRLVAVMFAFVSVLIVAVSSDMFMAVSAVFEFRVAFAPLLIVRLWSVS